MAVLEHNNSSSFSLFAACSYNSSLSEKDYFVGIKYENESLRINFPLGYKRASTEEELKKDVLNLIEVLSSLSDANESFIQNQKIAHKENVVFPIHAYLYLIKDFLTNGYYFEKEVVYTKSSNGKANWAKTARQVKPLLQDDSVFYTEFITRKVKHNENELISQIHQYCVWESFSKIGWLFSSFIPVKPRIKFNKSLFLSIIKTKLSQTFNEKTMLLFNYMIDVIEFLDKSSESKNFTYGTNEFEYIWESMVDSAFGEKNKTKYYPHCYWEIDGKKYSSDQLEFKQSALRPDTIMITDKGTENQKTFVLDSKYYRYGESRQLNHLPMSGSIIKQIAYAEYIEKKENRGELKHKSKAIYNAFIMPYESRKADENMKFVGFARTDYKTGDKSYYKIKAILVDTKWLMENHNRNDKMIKELAELIERGM
ncbi:MAG: LlaJI family restriction endonuclease [Treponema succinifaciens]|uniref:LlaJI family restriction endonuclease n=1 Tax=Treponema succinifaciens TaxID=167 RepID=UPI002A7643B5|nr:LlaJI family restriction endonuclease [Treponema succinifaciens]MDY2616225.1 LlaJI family restriction endonuclease [Treponema succinifaciens]